MGLVASQYKISKPKASLFHLRLARARLGESRLTSSWCCLWEEVSVAPGPVTHQEMRVRRSTSAWRQLDANAWQALIVCQKEERKTLQQTKSEVSKRYWNSLAGLYLEILSNAHCSTGPAPIFSVMSVNIQLSTFSLGFRCLILQLIIFLGFCEFINNLFTITWTQ